MSNRFWVVPVVVAQVADWFSILLFLCRDKIAQLLSIPDIAVGNNLFFFPCTGFMPVFVKCLHDQRKLFAGELLRQFFWQAVQDFTFCRGEKLAGFLSAPVLNQEPAYGAAR